jgi:FdhD protein
MIKSAVTTRLKAIHVTGSVGHEIGADIVRESPVTVRLAGRNYAVLMASPSDLDVLAVGFLIGEGALTSDARIEKIKVDGKNRIVDVQVSGSYDAVRKKGLITSGCASVALHAGAFKLLGLSAVKSAFKIRAGKIDGLMKALDKKSATYKATRGMHEAALSDGEGIIFFAEDVGRHNAIDKVVGRAFLSDIKLSDKLLLTSGRVSGEILLKCMRSGVPIVVSMSVPTDFAVRLAKKIGITLVGFARDGRFNIYSKKCRIVF